MSNSNNPTSETDPGPNADLVAYLDGELAEDDRLQVESRLATDESYRAELAQLQRTWDVLDVLPKTTADPSFTQSTIEMAALNAGKEKSSQRFNFGFWIQALVGILLLAIPAAAFYYGYQQRKEELKEPNEQAIADLLLFENLPLYRSVNAEFDVDSALKFLETMNNEDDIFLSIDDSEVAARYPDDSVLAQVSSGDISLEAVDRESMETILWNQRQFENLPTLVANLPEQHENLRKFHRQLLAHPNSDQLISTLKKFQEWLRNKGYYGQEEIDRLMDLSPEDRVKRIKEMEMADFEERYNNNRFFRSRGVPPARKDVPYLERLGKERIQDLVIETLASEEFDEETIKTLVQQMDLAPTVHHKLSNIMRARQRLSFSSDFGTLTLAIDELPKFIEGLSDESREKLQWLDESLQIQIANEWILGTLFQPGDADLLEFYDNGLNGRQRNSLDRLPPAERKSLLRKTYRDSVFERPIHPEDLTKKPPIEPAEDSKSIQLN